MRHALAGAVLATLLVIVAAVVSIWLLARQTPVSGRGEVGAHDGCGPGNPGRVLGHCRPFWSPLQF
jgi:hypothetical protein